jgi:hypothetical protein
VRARIEATPGVAMIVRDLVGSTSYEMESLALSGVEWVDDRDFRLVDGAAAIFFIRRFNDLTFQRILGTPKPLDPP